MSKPNIEADDFISVVRGLIRDTRELLGEVIRVNEARDKRATAQQTSWTGENGCEREEGASSTPSMVSNY